MKSFRMDNMKRKIFLKSVLLITTFIGFMACKQEWLKPEPLSLFAPENVYVDKDGFLSLLYTMRKDLRKEHTGNLPNHSLVNEYAASDLASPWSQLDFNKLTPSSSQFYGFLSMFTMFYDGIKNPNILINRIQDVEGISDDDKNTLLAEAYWHRAYWYYRLVNTYGNVPFIDEEIVGAKLDFYTHSRWAILNKIQKDLEFAVEWLPETAEPGAISKGAGNHLLAKVYLANGEFDKAIHSATEVINGPYSLMTTRFGSSSNDPVRNLIWDLHRPENFNIPQNTETILATIDRFEAPPGARSDGLFTMRLYNSQWHQGIVRDSEGKAGMVASGPMYDSLGRGNANVRLTNFYQYDLWRDKDHTWKNTPDLRRSDINWVDLDEIKYNNPSSVDYGKPVDISYLPSLADTFITLYAMPHYITYVPQQEPNAQPFGGNGDWYVFRLAETYLLRAEAFLWKGQLSEAANDINVVRRRANASLIEAGDVSIDFIFDERARELFGEEPRHGELVRASYIMAKLGIDGYSLTDFSDRNYYYDRVTKFNITYQQKVTQRGNTANIAPFHVLWPIPSDVIKANTLGVINQNIGYQGGENNVDPNENID